MPSYWKRPFGIWDGRTLGVTRLAHVTSPYA
ncbi:hypothetical protein DBR06_SOUSAS11710053, partial [Sousa chinensis]